MNYEIFKIPHQLGPLDSQGIPLVDYKDRRGIVYNPVTVTQYGLAHHQRWLRTGDNTAQSTMLECARWLVHNQVVDAQRDLGTWVYTFDLPEIKVKAPWISGMAQGQALSLLSRSWSLNGDEAFYVCAQRAARVFHVRVEDGGVVSEIEPNLTFYEEVAATPAIHILNGFLYALVGLYEYEVAWPGDQVQVSLQRGLTTGRRVLDRFDSGYWSRYSLMSSNHIADLHYHRVHIRQLDFLGNVCAVPEFKECAQRWSGYLTNRSARIRQFMVLWTQKIERRFRA